MSNTNEEWFHDEWANSVNAAEVDVEGAWTAVAAPEAAWIERTLGSVVGLKVLDLGSGLGEGAIHFAQHGAIVTACDLSTGMLNVATQVAKVHGVQIATEAASATDLSVFHDESFDVVYAANLLHHVDIERCLLEVRRVLKSGGRAAFWDPVQYNPAINVYRKMASGVRTVDEHPLRVRDLQTIRRLFPEVKVKYFWLSACLIFVRFFLVDRIQPSEGRYWKIVIERRKKHRRFLEFFHGIDRFLLRIIPPLRWWCWNIAVVVRKG